MRNNKVTWEQLSWHERIQQVNVIDDTYMFASSYRDAQQAAWNVRHAAENDLIWFGFEVLDFDKFERDLREILSELYFE